MQADYHYINPFLAIDEAANMLRIAESFGSFGTYADEGTSEGLGEKLPQRFDVAMNYTGNGIDGQGNDEDPQVAVQRTNYFRETYAYGADIHALGIQSFLDQQDLLSTARRVIGRDVIVPAIVYANMLVPGQELAIHTDVPEFRGASRKTLPQWLLVVMLHSGMFDKWRIPIATCVSWFGDASGGAFTFYPEGPTGSRVAIAATHNSAILIDTDQVFHGVERVDEQRPELPTIDRTARLHFVGSDSWQLRQGAEVLAEYSWPELRYSISWKAYCFRDAAEEALWRDGTDKLSVEFILAQLETELRNRGVLTGARPEATEFALMLVNTFVTFPRASAAA